MTSIIASLFRHVRGQPRDRLVGKFVENDHEKVDRLLELHFKYSNKVKGGRRERNWYMLYVYRSFNWSRDHNHIHCLSDR